MNYYVGTYGKTELSGIYLVKNDVINLVVKSSSASYQSYDNGVLYSIYADGLMAIKDNKIISKAIEKHKPTHIFAKDKYVFTCSYQSGELNYYKYEKNSFTLIENIKHGNNANTHQVVFDINDKILYCVNLGLDNVVVYSVSDDKLIRIAELKTNKGSGPRHLIKTRSGYIYVLCEYSNQIYIYDSEYKIIDVVENNHLSSTIGVSAAIRTTKCEKHLYITIRGSDIIVHYTINENGLLTYKKHYPTSGMHPRDFNITNDSKYIIIANMHSNNISVFNRLSDGSLSLKKTVECLEPCCITPI